MMKKLFSILAASLLAAVNGFSQTADVLVTEGRAFLAAHDITNANLKFTAAVSASPNHETANVFRGLTRLFILPNQPAADALLTRLGMSDTNRNVFNWTDWFPEDDSGGLLAPDGVNASEITGYLRTNALPEISAAASNLSRVIGTNFLLTLTAEETPFGEMTLDYGDIQMLRTLLHFTEYFIHTFNAHDLNMQLTTLRSCYTNGEFSLERMLSLHPQLLTYASTNDLAAAQIAFTNMVACYARGSAFIWERPFGVERLFEFDYYQYNAENNFRRTLEDLRDSLTGPVILQTDTNYTVYLPSHFSGQHSWRSLLPQFRGHSIVLGKIPDPSFGGLVQSPSFEELVESELAKIIGSVPGMSAISQLSGSEVQFPLHLIKGRGYVIQASIDLVNWFNMRAFVADSSTVNVIDTTEGGQRFYRVVDQTENMPRPANDDFANRETLSGLGVTTTSYNSTATVEPNEPFYYYRSIWYSWTAPISGPVVFADSTGNSYITVYTGNTLASLNYQGEGWRQATVHVTAGVTYQISVGGFGDLRLVTFTIARPPVVVISSPTDEEALTGPTNVTFTATATEGDNAIQQFEFFISGNLFQVFYFTNGGTQTVTLTNLPFGSYYFSARATDAIGIAASDAVNFRVAPSNDNFAKAITLSGSSSIITSTTAGAGFETGEPDHSGDWGYGGASVWYKWSASSSHGVTLMVEHTNSFGFSSPLIAVYKGATLSTLTLVTNSGADGYFSSPDQVSFPAVNGTTYRIAIDDLYRNQEDFIFRMIPTFAPSVNLINPVDGETFLVGTNITLTASASDSDGTVTNVQFFLNGQLLGSDTTAPYGASWNNADFGWHTIRAVATDNLGAQSSHSISVLVDFPPPANDNFADAAAAIENGVVNGSNQGATREMDEPYHAGYGGFRSVWWTWTASQNGLATISTSGSDFDTVLAVYVGSTVDNLSEVASNDDSQGSTSSVTFNATAGVTYRIAVDGYSSSSGMINLSVQLSSPAAGDLAIVGVEDLNADGSPDLVWNDQVDLTAAFLDGTNLTSLVPLPPPSLDYTFAGAADFNGDVEKDLLWMLDDGRLLAWMMNGTDVTGSQFLRNGTPITTGWRSVGTRDFNGDESSDVVFQHFNGKLAVWFMNGTNYLNSILLRNGQPVAGGWRAIALDDFNADDKADILFQHDDGQLAIWQMNGTNFLSEVELRGGVTPPAGYRVAGAGDFNSDGQPDILFQNENAPLLLWFMNGTTFVSESEIPFSSVSP